MCSRLIDVLVAPSPHHEPRQGFNTNNRACNARPDALLHGSITQCAARRATTRIHHAIRGQTHTIHDHPHPLRSRSHTPRGHSPGPKASITPHEPRQGFNTNNRACNARPDELIHGSTTQCAARRATTRIHHAMRGQTHTTHGHSHAMPSQHTLHTHPRPHYTATNPRCMTSKRSPPPLIRTPQDTSA